MNRYELRIVQMGTMPSDVKTLAKMEVTPEQMETFAESVMSGWYGNDDPDAVVDRIPDFVDRMMKEVSK